MLLSVDHNLLSGTIPSQLGKLTNVRSLLLGSGAGLKKDRITGTLPTELGQLSMLNDFSIGK